MNFLERFSKIHKPFFYKFFGAQGQRERERGTDIVNRISQFRYNIKNFLHIYRRSAKFLTFLQIVEPISNSCLSGQQSYPLAPLTDTNALSS